MSLKNRLIEAAINRKLANGTIQDTGKVYDPQAARDDASNPALRMTANVNDNGDLTWQSDSLQTSITGNVFNRFAVGQQPAQRNTQSTPFDTQWLEVLQAVAISTDPHNKNAVKLVKDCIAKARHETQLSKTEQQQIRLAYLRTLEG